MTQPTEAQADIVERLLLPWFTNGCEAYQREAAAEITRLRETVRRVQSAAKTIMIGEADELRSLREQRREWHLAVNSLDSEREANAVLTSEVELLRAQLAEAELRGVKAGLEAGARVADTWTACDYSEECNVMADSIARELRAIDPATLMKDADHG